MNCKTAPIYITVSGCFDLLHAGHVRFLEYAKGFGDKLYVFLASDDYVAREKGIGRPIISQDDRAFMLKSLRCVDEVVIINDEAQILQAIKDLNICQYNRINYILGDGETYSPDGISVLRAPRFPGGDTTTIIEKINESKS